MNKEKRSRLFRIGFFLIVTIFIGVILHAGYRRQFSEDTNGSNLEKSEIHPANGEEGGRIGSSLESCILKYGDSGMNAQGVGDDGRHMAAYTFNTTGYRLNCFFIDGKLERVGYYKRSGFTERGSELSYEEIRKIVKMHIRNGEWYNLTKEGDTVGKYANEIDGYYGMYDSFSENELLPNWVLIVGTSDGITKYEEFASSKRWEEKSRLIDEL
jgi:hypothetical protein